MRNSEEAVRRVLEGLRDVEAPTGMESRIVLALERRAAEAARIDWRRKLKVFWPSPVMTRNLASCVAFAGVACVVLWVPKANRSAVVPMVTLRVNRPALVTGVFAPSSLKRRAGERLQRVNAVRMSAGQSSDALALAETRAPSQPAQALPFTEQEILLLRVARRHDPEQMAMLNLEARHKQELQAKVEFEAFFKPAQLVQEKPQTGSTDQKGDTQ